MTLSFLNVVFNVIKNYNIEYGQEWAKLLQYFMWLFMLLFFLRRPFDNQPNIIKYLLKIKYKNQFFSDQSQPQKNTEGFDQASIFLDCIKKYNLDIPRDPNLTIGPSTATNLTECSTYNIFITVMNLLTNAVYTPRITGNGKLEESDVTKMMNQVESSILS